MTFHHPQLAPSVFNEDVIRTSSFPEYVAPDFVDDMSGEALGYVPYRITEVLVQSQTPYFNLKVSKLTPQDFSTALIDYLTECIPEEGTY